MLNIISPDNTCKENNNNTELGDMNKTLNLQHISRIGFPITLTPGEATMEDIQLHAILRQRLSRSTAHKRIITLQYLANHQQPIDISSPTLEQWIRHSDYREQIENAGPHSLSNEWKAMKTLLKAYNIPIWDYRPPTKPGRQKRTIQRPQRVREMIQYAYTNNPDRNKHLQYILLATYMIGLRNPSETVILKTTDVNLDNGTITITEPKKHYSTREIRPAAQYMNGSNCKSMKNWIDYIRPQYTTQKSKDYLFVTYTGNPYTKDYLRKDLAEHIRPAFPEYQPYISRHWAATARLIQEYVETKNWNKGIVQRWLGHEQENTTDTYICQAETYLQIEPCNWFHRVLKKHKTEKSVCGKHGEKRQNGDFDVCPTDLLPLAEYEPVGVCAWAIGEKQNDIRLKKRSVLFGIKNKINDDGAKNNGLIFFSLHYDAGERTSEEKEYCLAYCDKYKPIVILINFYPPLIERSESYRASEPRQKYHTIEGINESSLYTARSPVLLPPIIEYCSYDKLLSTSHIDLSSWSRQNSNECFLYTRTVGSPTLSYLILTDEGIDKDIPKRLMVVTVDPSSVSFSTYVFIMGSACETWICIVVWFFLAFPHGPADLPSLFSYTSNPDGSCFSRITIQGRNESSGYTGLDRYFGKNSVHPTSSCFIPPVFVLVQTSPSSFIYQNLNLINIKLGLLNTGMTCDENSSHVTNREKVCRRHIFLASSIKT